jgi:hypothetical protein
MKRPPWSSWVLCHYTVLPTGETRSFRGAPHIEKGEKKGGKEKVFGKGKKVRQA